MFCAFSVTKRPLKPEDEGKMEADHIPPMDSLKRAKDEPNFKALQNNNRVLYDMVMSLETDPKGRNLLAMVVSTPHHRRALSTGSSKESKAARYCLLRCFLLTALCHLPILFRSSHTHTHTFTCILQHLKAKPYTDILMVIIQPFETLGPSHQALSCSCVCSRCFVLTDDAAAWILQHDNQLQRPSCGKVSNLNIFQHQDQV